MPQYVKKKVRKKGNARANFQIMKYRLYAALFEKKKFEKNRGMLEGRMKFS